MPRGSLNVLVFVTLLRSLRHLKLGLGLLHREQQISYTTPLFKDFSTGAFKDGRTVFCLRSVIITLHGASILFSACSNFSVSLPRYCKNIIAFSTSSSSSVSSCLSSGFVMIVFNVFLKINFLKCKNRPFLFLCIRSEWS